MLVTRVIGTKTRRRPGTSTTRPTARGDWRRALKTATTSRTRPSWSPSGSKAASPASRATKTRLGAPLTMRPGYSGGSAAPGGPPRAPGRGAPAQVPGLMAGHGRGAVGGRDDREVGRAVVPGAERGEVERGEPGDERAGRPPVALGGGVAGVQPGGGEGGRRGLPLRGS